MERSKIKGEQSGTQAQDQTTKDTKILKICTAKDATSRAGKTYKLAISEFEIGLRKGARPFWRRWQAVDVRPTLQVYKNGAPLTRCAIQLHQEKTIRRSGLNWARRRALRGTSS